VTVSAAAADRAIMTPMAPDCGHPLCELIGGSCSLASGRSRGCHAGFASTAIEPEVLDEVRALLSEIDLVGQGERARSAAIRLAAILRREARDDRNLLALARDDVPDLASALARMCLRRR
jgi:hypothetical protein